MHSRRYDNRNQFGDPVWEHKKADVLETQLLFWFFCLSLSLLISALFYWIVFDCGCYYITCESRKQRLFHNTGAKLYLFVYCQS